MAQKKRKNKKQKISFLNLIISIIIIIVIYLINRLIFIRPILWLIAVIFITLFIKQFINKMNKAKFIVWVIILFFASIIVDGIIVTVFKKIPAFTYNVVSSDNVNIYYSPGLRVWQCDKNSYKNLKVDKFYNSGYYCDVNDLSTADINSFLNSVVENYDDYGNKYVKVSGKISKKNSQNSIELRPYTESEVKVNGYVEFSNSIVLKVLFEKNQEILDNYDVYDDIIIIGLVKNIEEADGSYTVYMDNAKVLSNNTISDFSVSVTGETSCTNSKLLAENDNEKLYSYCLSEIFVTSNGSTSELLDVISSNKIEIKDIYKKYTSKAEDDTGNTIYRLDGYSVLVCNKETSNKIVIGKTNLKFTDISCSDSTE